MDNFETNRRAFVQGAGLAAVATATAQAQDAPKPAAAAEKGEAKTLPRRKLGKTGVEITMLNQGAVRGSSYDRILRFAYSQGVRTFDTAKVYGTEPNFKKWFEQSPEVRKDIFLVTKDMPKKASELIRMLDERLETLGTDYVDLFFVHGLGDQHSTDEAIEMVTGQEFKETAEKIRKSGKAKFVGFSSHHKDRGLIIQKAAEAGFVDAVMLQYTPWLDKDSPLNRGLDVAHEKGLGLITMKHIAGQFFGDKPKGDILGDVQKKVPMLKERNLTPFQGLLHAIWTDERLASSCISMRNTDHIRENIDALMRFEPVKVAQIMELRDAALAHGPTLCADCDGRCSKAAGTKAELGVLTRYLTYHQHLGDRQTARKQFADLPTEAKDWKDADLVAAREACPNKLDFAALMPKVDEYLA
jgi:predicted aldo/keto reductase-like oxidoreductase